MSYQFYTTNKKMTGEWAYRLRHSPSDWYVKENLSASGIPGVFTDIQISINAAEPGSKAGGVDVALNTPHVTFHHGASGRSVRIYFSFQQGVEGAPKTLASGAYNGTTNPGMFQVAADASMVREVACPHRVVRC